MSKEEVLKEISNLLDQKLKNLEPKEPPKAQSSGSGDSHKTIVEMLDCPTCSAGFKDRLKHEVHQIMGVKECKECQHIDGKDEEYCESCGNDY